MKENKTELTKEDITHLANFFSFLIKLDRKQNINIINKPTEINKEKVVIGGFNNVGKLKKI